MIDWLQKSKNKNEDRRCFISSAEKVKKRLVIVHNKEKKGRGELRISSRRHVDV
jgi:hypothetical protein